MVGRARTREGNRRASDARFICKLFLIEWEMDKCFIIVRKRQMLFGWAGLFICTSIVHNLNSAADNLQTIVHRSKVSKSCSKHSMMYFTGISGKDTGLTYHAIMPGSWIYQSMFCQVLNCISETWLIRLCSLYKCNLCLSRLNRLWVELASPLQTQWTQNTFLGLSGSLWSLDGINKPTDRQPLTSLFDV